jgi:dTMP kinase
MNEMFAPIPDLVFIFDIEAKGGLKRIADRKQKDMLFEREDYLVKVRDIFNSIRGENIHHIDARQPIEIVAAKIEEITLSCLASLS